MHLRLSFIGANPQPRLEPFQRLEMHVSYVLGHDPAKWHADVPVWGGVRYVGLYPGIDLEVGADLAGLGDLRGLRLFPAPPGGGPEGLAGLPVVNSAKNGQWN